MNGQRMTLLAACALWVAGLAAAPVEAAGAGAEPNRPTRPRTVARLTRGALLQSVDKAKKGGRSELQWITKYLCDGRHAPPKELLPEFRGFLKDEDPEVQMLGAQGLGAIKDPNSRADLVEYIESKDLHNWADKHMPAKEQGNRGVLLVLEWQAAMQAILALGETGDKSVIPLLESLRSVKGLGFESGPGPVEQALAKLGPEGIHSLASLGPDADRDQISQAGRAMRLIRDPGMIPTLIETVKDAKVAEPIRAAAVDAIGDMNNVDEVLPFLMATMRQADYPQYVRSSAALALARSRRPAAEKALQDLLDQPNCDIRVECLQGLASLDPNRYLPVQLKIVLDKSAPVDERENLAHRLEYCSRERIMPHVELIRQGLQAVESDGTPADSIRISVWRALNKATGEKPTLELRDPRSARLALSDEIEQRVLAQNHQAGPSEMAAAVEREVNAFVVQWQPEKASAKP